MRHHAGWGRPGREFGLILGSFSEAEVCRRVPEERQLPSIRADVVAQDPKIAGVIQDLEVPVIRTEPAVDDVGDLDDRIAEPEASRRFFASIACVALHLHGKQRAQFDHF